MSYSRIPDNFEVLRFATWWSVEELTTVLKSIKNINFSITEQRQQALQSWNNLASVCPFSKIHRFPKSRTFVCSIYGDWARKEQQLVSALCYKNYTKDEKAKVPSETGFSDFNDAHMSYRNAVTNMFNQLYRMDGVFSRQTFESRFFFEWDATKTIEREDHSDRETFSQHDEEESTRH